MIFLLSLNKIPLKKLISISIYILLPFLVSSQIPGFLGKKNTISITGAFGPSLGPNSLNNTGFGINKRYGLQYTRIISRHLSLGASYVSFNTAVDISADDIFSQQTPPFSIKSQTLGIHLTLFPTSSDYIAPVGKYYSLDFNIVQYTLVDENKALFASTTDIMQGLALAPGITVGKKRVLFRKLLLDYAIQGAFFLRDQDARIPSSGLDKRLTDINNYVLETTERLQRSFFFNIKLGLGYLF